MRKIISILTLALLLTVSSCIIQNLKPDECEIVTAKIIKISEGPSYDIEFHDNHGDYYYINRGLERDLNLETLNASVLNKTVTLHLAKILGVVTSEHISQLAIGDTIIFTEFK